MRPKKFRLMSGLIAASLILSSCGGSSTSTKMTTSPPAYTIGGAAAGLAGSGLVLQNNGENNLTITANGIFTFSDIIPSGGTYSVTILTQPSNPVQTCAVSNGSGTATANITNVQISCTTNLITTYLIGGTVSGLSGTGLVLQNNAGDNLTPSVNGTFTFSTAIRGGATYSVTVLTQPSNPAQSCVVTNGSGTASANVTNIQVACSTSGSSSNQWTWQSGPEVSFQSGVYGTQGMPASTNIPGARSSAVTWTDASNNFWLFGGYGLDSTGALGPLNDLWEYSAGQWTWMGGSDLTYQAGIYGIEGVAASANIPGSRSAAISWIDVSGNFWLFGGEGLDSAGSDGQLNDLWKYSAGQWTWVSGSNLGSQIGVYGTEGTAASSNVPGARSSSVSWIDAAGNFWLFGGYGSDANGNDGAGYLNDLWKYTAGQGSQAAWTWISGSNTIDQPGIYGTEGAAASSNVPGARSSAVSWIDSLGNFWLFSGTGQEASSNVNFNDLWKYNAGQGTGAVWAWVSGSNQPNQPGTYGTEGTSAPADVPGSRSGAVSWNDATGNLWLFGGCASTLCVPGADYLNDLWKYNAGQTSGAAWTWVSGSDTTNQPGTYGTKGSPAATNAPGARQASATWIDASGNLWLFGGVAVTSSGTAPFSDLWQYQP